MMISSNDEERVIHVLMVLREHHSCSCISDNVTRVE